MASAGKNLTTSRPYSSACCISVGVSTPGIIGMDLPMQYSTTFTLKPGETIKRAPASITLLASATVSTVPAPTSMSGKNFTMRSTTCTAVCVRRVTSITGKPFSLSVCASGTALFSSSTMATGRIPRIPICSRMLFILRRYSSM